MGQKIYQENYIAVYKYILYLTNEAQLTHDLLQETFYRFYKQQASNIDNPKAFLLRIARNIVYDHFRKKRIVQFFTLIFIEKRNEQISLVSFM
jgi:RNA polymerase sigma-70 factor, ECF subfamily